jgi:hypothetical protein
MTEQNWIPSQKDTPQAPRNVKVVSSFEVGGIDIRWDDPSIALHNKDFQVVGVNIYRSDDSEFGPYRRINSYPVGSNFYRDQTTNCFVQDEVINLSTGYYQFNDGANVARYILRSRFTMVKKDGQAVPANAPGDVVVRIDGERVEPLRVYGQTGEVELNTKPWFDPASEDLIQPVLPKQNSEVLLSYYRPRNVVQSGLDSKSWYRVSTVALDHRTPSCFIETPLEWCEPHSKYEIESIDYVWREAVRRNNWILEQGGERVKVFIRKTCGIPCYCTWDPATISTSKQPSNNCGLCFGTGFLGGYTGPFEVIIAPDDGERRVEQTAQGRTMRHTYDTWFGPSPLVTQRDFIVKQSNERYSIGGVRRPTNRGNIMQQMFQIGFLEENDIRYKVPIFGVEKLPWPQCRISGQQFYHQLYFRDQDVPYQVGPDARLPMATEKGNVPDAVELRGRTAAWENWMY